MEIINDDARPSFFELAAQEQLRDLLQPVVRYLLSVLATRYPRYMLRFSNRHEETYAALMFFIERHYLKQWSGSFAENFYGMKRRRRPGVSSERAQAAADLFSDHQALRKRELRWSLFFLIAVPYLRAKGDDLYDRIGGNNEGGDLFADQDRQQEADEITSSRLVSLQIRSASLFKALWPKLNKVYDAAILFYNIAYLFEKTPYYRPWLHWLGIDVRRMTERDYRAGRAAQESLRQSTFGPDPSTGAKPSKLEIVIRCLRLGPQLALEGLKVFLPASIFFFKFLEWWYSSSYARARLSTSKATNGPPALRAPPSKLKPHPEGLWGKHLEGEAPKAGFCVVCRNHVVNPTALPTGYVGDYRCLFEYVEKEGKCPVTRMKVTTGDLRKVNG